MQKFYLKFLLGGLAAILFHPINSTAAIAPVVLERGPHHRVVQSLSSYINEFGERIQQTGQYTEIANGLHYFANGQWHETQELIEPSPQGAVALHGPYQVIFSQNLNTAGAIDMLMPDGKRLTGGVLAISATDAATGETIILGEVQDSIGEILPPNQMIYRDAFSGLAADVRYTYAKGYFEADVIIRERPAMPDHFDPATTRLDIITEFLRAPVPTKTHAVLKRKPELVDETLDFGQMRMILGKAFEIAPNARTKTPVAKRWREVDGRKILIESVEYELLRPSLEQLPAGEVRRQAKSTHQLPDPRTQSLASKPIEIAQAIYNPTGVVIDYVLVYDQSNYTFLSGETYLVSGPVQLSNTTTFQSGAVIKYTPGAYIILGGQASFPTAGPKVIFTARDDDTVGEKIATAPLSGTYAFPALHFNTDGISVEIKNAQFRHAETAI